MNTTIMQDNKVYAIRGARGLVKIGTTRDLGKRLASLQTGSPVKLKLVAVGPGDRELEQRLHEKYKHRRRVGEWFALSGREVAELEAFLGGSTTTIYLPKVRAKRYRAVKPYRRRD